MQAIGQSRRKFLRAVAAGCAVAATPFPARAATRESVVDAAKRESGLVWYDHYDRAASEGLLNAFQRVYPFVRQVEFVDVPSAEKVAKIVQESMAGGPTSDILIADAVGLQSMADRGLLQESDWSGLGVAASPVTTPNPFMILTTTAPYVLLYNTRLIKEADVPRTWDETVDPKWKGQVGHWMRPQFFVTMVAAVGEDKARELAHKLGALHPRLFDGQFPLAQSVGSGEVSLAITAYDSSMRIIESGAPVKMVAIDPVPTSLLCSGILKYAKNPNTARLFLSWLATPEGAKIFEKMTKRGNLFVEGTETSKFVKGRKIAYFTPEQAIAQKKKLNALEVELTRVLAGR